ncbi:SEC12-like protein 1 [Hordeum vulgare subsp. vulgare]|uniref:SEC12-like protein 1 n=1 Tax=Hordeum vulgare subsp. vulgare TaxID=112509 RepID=A0A8I7BFL7_HORVV|nr:SEC12-like protein 1 [Hordeum vulgare subsp. vulgare]
MAGDGEGPPAGVAGKVTCAAWIRRPRAGPSVSGSRSLLVVYGRGATPSSPPFLDLLAFDTAACALDSESEPLLRVVMGEEGADADTPSAIAVHPAGDEFVCATAKGCRLFKLLYDDFCINFVSRDSPPLQSVGPQRCLAFSTDGTKFAIGGEDGHLRIFHWPNLSVLLDEPKAHKSFRDMDISLDSAYLVSTSTDGSARIWKIDEGAPLVNLTRSSDEKIECCRFSRDGKKPFLFCTLVKGNDTVTMVLNISNWKRIGYKRLLRKPISTLSVSLDGMYLALGSCDGDCCVADVKSMQVSHMIKKVHLGSPVSSIEFCPTERIVISMSNQWGAEITKLDVPADWRVWQIWLVFLSLFVVSAILFYTFFKHTNLV